MAAPRERRARTYLTIDYDSKDWAKRHGARWDKERKRWYVLGVVPEMLLPYVDGSMAGQPPKEIPEEERQKAQARATAARPKSLLRTPPPNDAQADFFVPALYDVATKDSRSLMDVAVFRLSKDKKRAGEIIRYELPDGYVEVKAGPDGMASIWDYDYVLMVASHLTEAMNRYRAGLGEKPGKLFRPHAAEIRKFCRRGDGGRQADEVEPTLDRLMGTMIKSVRERTGSSGARQREVEAEGLISRYRVVSRTDTGKVADLEIEAPEWLYRAIVDGKQPNVLTVHPDYFLIEPGIGRFVYRLARRAAGKGAARWAFRTIFERSGSTGEFKEFSRHLRKIIDADALPEYTLALDKGEGGPMLVMQYRYATPILPVEGG